MSDEHNEQSQADYSAADEPALAEPAGPWSPTEREGAAIEAHGRRPPARAALWLAALLILVIAGVLSSPFWAPAVRPLLPWAEPSDAAKYDTLAQRVAGLEQRPVIAPIDQDAIKSAQTALAQKIAALEGAVAALRQTREDAATKAALTQESQRLDAAEAQAAERAAAQAAEIDKMRQELAQRGAVGGELATRVDALEHQLHAQNSIDRGEGVRVLALLQLREAVEAGQPFTAEYAALSQLAANDPELAAAARPLGDAARSGVATRAELRHRLGDLADHIDSANAPRAKPNSAKPKWWEEALDRVRALVTVRHIDGAAKTGSGAAVEAAQTALAQDNLAGAVAALDGLGRADAEAMQPWLKAARQRLAAEAALTRLQGLLTARLGAPPASPGATAPAPAPDPSASKTP
jgi:hypothetical protein